VLGIPRDAPLGEIERAHKVLRSLYHPDKGGDAAKFHEAQVAYDEATKERFHDVVS
jgi:curved DNA-binding protein